MGVVCAPTYPRPFTGREEGRQGELRRCGVRARPGVTARPWLTPGTPPAWAMVPAGACGFHAECGFLPRLKQGLPAGCAVSD